jgi:hypothetical protein
MLVAEQKIRINQDIRCRASRRDEVDGKPVFD